MGDVQISFEVDMDDEMVDRIVLEWLKDGDICKS